MVTYSSHLFPSSPFNSLLVLRQLKNSKQLPFEKFKSFLSLFRLPPHPHPSSLVLPSRTTQNKLNIISTKLSSVFFSSPFSLPSFPVSSKYIYSSSSPLQPTCSRRRLIWPVPSTPTWSLARPSCAGVRSSSMARQRGSRGTCGRSILWKKGRRGKKVLGSNQSRLVISTFCR